MDKNIMKKALIHDIVFDEFDKFNYIDIFNANENKYLRVYSEEIGSINIKTCRKNSLVDYVEIDDKKASFKRAIPIKRKIVINGLINEKIKSCMVTDTKEWGAFVSIMGISCVLRNCDFSNDATAVRDIYKKGDTIEGIKFRKISSKDRISLEMKDKYTNPHSLSEKSLKKGNIVLGMIRNVKEEQNRCFVGISKGFDLLSSIPKGEKVSEGQKVVCRITGVNLEGYGIRGKILNIL